MLNMLKSSYTSFDSLNKILEVAIVGHRLRRS